MYRKIILTTESIFLFTTQNFGKILCTPKFQGNTLKTLIFP